MVYIASRRSVAAIALGSALLSHAAALRVDSRLRQSLPSQVVLELEAATRPSAHDTLFVYLPGMLADSKSMSKAQRARWRQHGDMLLVDYTGERFRPEQVVDTVVEFISKHVAPNKRVVFIGSSLGGLLAADCYERLRLLVQNKISIVPLDAPTTATDLQSPLDKIAPVMHLPFGPIYDFVVGPIAKAVMRPPQEANISPEADRQVLERRFMEMKSYSFIFYRDQVNYIISHGKLAFGSLRGLEQMVYVRSTRDHDTVRERAYAAWWVAYGQKPTLIKVDSAHVAFLEQPNNWDAAIKEIIRVLGL